MDTLTQSFNVLRGQDVKSQAAWLAQLCYYIGGDESPTVWWQFYKLLQSIYYMDDKDAKSPNAKRFIDEARSRIKVSVMYDKHTTSIACQFVQSRHVVVIDKF